MKYLVSKSEMKQYDANTMQTFGLPSMVLIERAALAAMEELQPMPHRILVACGSGNNGADGLALGRLLYLQGCEVQVLLVGTKSTEERKHELAIAKNYGVPLVDAEDYLAAPEKFPVPELVVDALFGVGLSRRLEGVYEKVVDCLNHIQAKKMALDIPSGIDADTGAILGIAFRADVTVTFSYEKVGLWLFPGQAYSGRVICRRVGIDDRSFLVQEKQGHAPGVAAFTKEDLARIPARRADSNKGSYGKVLVVAGSVDMAGAAIFSAKAAYLSGCGLVRILTPEENRIIIQSTLPEAVLTSYNSKKPDRETINGAMQWADVIVCGPGLGRGEAARLLVHTVLKNAAVPVILDADALNIISEETEILQRPHTELILTPHLGEMARLCGVTISYIKDHLLESAQEFARTYNLILAQKDARTITAIPYGMTYVNLSGNNGMATGGSGDVLTGVIAGLIAQGADPALAAPLGVYIHGLAGDAGAKSIGCYSLTAGTLLDALPGIFQEAAEKQAVPLISETKKEGNER